MLFASRSGVYITFSWIWVDICLMKRIWQKLCSWRKAKLEKAMPFLPVSLRTCSGSLQSPCESSYSRTAVSGDDVEMKESVREGGRERKRDRGRELLAIHVCPAQVLTCKIRRLQGGVSFSHCLTATSRAALNRKHPAKFIPRSDSRVKEMIALIWSLSFRVVCSEDWSTDSFWSSHSYHSCVFFLQ